MDIYLTFIISNQSFFRSIERQSLTFSTFSQFCNIIQTEYHILGGYGDRRTISRVQNIMCLKHQHLSFQYSFIAQRQVNSHLVTVKVGIERSTCQWMQLDSLTFNHVWLECLDTQTVQCRRTVQQYRMTFHYMLQDIPNNRLFTVYYLLG